MTLTKDVNRAKSANITAKLNREITQMNSLNSFNMINSPLPDNY